MTNGSRYQLRIDISIRDSMYSGGLSVSETVELDVSGFMEMAGILGQFHQLAEKFKEVKK